MSDTLLARNRYERIIEWLEEAAEDVQEWGNYASPFFEKKHVLSGNVGQYQARADLVREGLVEEEKRDA